MCSSRKYPYPPHGRLMEIPRGRGVSKAKFFEWKYGTKREFLEGWGVQFEKPSMGGVWIFSGTTQCMLSSWWDTSVCTTCIQWALQKCWDIFLQLYKFYYKFYLSPLWSVLSPFLKTMLDFFCLRLASFLYVHNIEKEEMEGFSV